MTTPNPETPKPKTKSSKFMLLIVALIACGALFMSIKLTQTQKDQTKQLDKAVNMLIQQQSSTEARFQAHQAVSVRQNAEAKQARLSIETQIKSTLDQCQHVSDDWRLYKARHLLELAQLNANFSHDNEQTLAMLKAAEDVLAPIHNPALLTVRQKLSNDIAAQQNAAKLDSTALFIKLTTAEKQTGSLPVTPLPKEQITLKPENNNASLKAKLLQGLNHLVTIKYHESPLKPTPTLAYETMLRATVRLNLEEAKWAVLERNEAVYQAALDAAIQYLEETFGSDSLNTKHLIAALKDLKAVKLVDAAIIPTNALSALNQAIHKTQHTPNGADA